MRKLAQKIATLITGEPASTGRRRFTRRDLIRLESRIGSQLFGEVPKGHRREFFCLDRSTWIWYEEWIDQTTRKKSSSTVRYEIHDNGILKVQEGQPYKFVEGQELHNLIWAMHIYYEEVSRQVYSRDPKTGHPLPQAANV